MGGDKDGDVGGVDTSERGNDDAEGALPIGREENEERSGCISSVTADKLSVLNSVDTLTGNTPVGDGIYRSTSSVVVLGKISCEITIIY